jgi:lysophospholipase L1-like esterase
MPLATDPARRRRRRRTVFAVLALVLGLGAVLAVVEVSLRVFDPLGRHYHDDLAIYRAEALRYTWERLPPPPPGAVPEGLDLDGPLYLHRPNLDRRIGSFHLRTNSLGFRGPEVAAAKPAGTFRILVLGDSVAFGWGVDDDATFVRRFEAEANAAGKPPRIEVVNTALPMYDSVQQLAVLRDFGLALQPDLVVLVYVVNDIEPTRDVVEQHFLARPPHPEEEPPPATDVWTRLSGAIQGLLPATADLLRLQIDPAAIWRQEIDAQGSYWPERIGKGPRGWRRSQDALRAMRDLCAATAIPFVVLDQTVPPVRSLPPFCAAEHIPYAELRLGAEETVQDILNSRIDTHLNPRGHELLLRHFQRALAPWLPQR